MSAFHVYAPAPFSARIVWAKCYGCADTGRREKRSPLFVQFFEYFDPEATCLRCGEHLGHARPWSRAWRAKNIAWALRKLERLRWDIRETAPMEGT